MIQDFFFGVAWVQVERFGNETEAENFGGSLNSFVILFFWYVNVKGINLSGCH